METEAREPIGKVVSFDKFTHEGKIRGRTTFDFRISKAGNLIVIPGEHVLALKEELEVDHFGHRYPFSREFWVGELIYRKVDELIPISVETGTEGNSVQSVLPPVNRSLKDASRRSPRRW